MLVIPNFCEILYLNLKHFKILIKTMSNIATLLVNNFFQQLIPKKLDQSSPKTDQNYFQLIYFEWFGTFKIGLGLSTKIRKHLHFSDNYKTFY